LKYPKAYLECWFNIVDFWYWLHISVFYLVWQIRWGFLTQNCVFIYFFWLHVIKTETLKIWQKI
jgi:hypothetical protein